MAMDALSQVTRVRSNSNSTLKAKLSNKDDRAPPASSKDESKHLLQTTLSIHSDTFSREAIFFAETCLTGSGLQEGDLVEVQQSLDGIETRDFEASPPVSNKDTAHCPTTKQNVTSASASTYLCTVKLFSSHQASKQHNIGVSINKHIATAFNFTAPSRVTIVQADKKKWTSSHVEISFRDAYLSRSDMWRFATQELVGSAIHSGQRLSFMNSLKATVRSIHVNGRRTKAAYFGSTTVPVFRSEAARYVIFIQMSREMWDFDSEGNGEILFNRVVYGFLPELFRKWTSMEIRHLVSIIMFGRLEYKRSDIVEGQGALSAGFTNQSPSFADDRIVDCQDFYKVVVTDMASAQWTTILEELKRDFRTFLRDVSLFKTPDLTTQSDPDGSQNRPKRITGRLSGALKGNVLEAINIAATQFSSDYIDRDLIRTGISTIVITAGSGVFDVDKDLLKLTSEALTNNGIGIDVVCLSRMPLHSVPLFRYPLEGGENSRSINGLRHSLSHTSLSTTLPAGSLPDMSHSPAFSSANASLRYYSRFPSALSGKLPQMYGYGIPQWIDLSYWSSDMAHEGPRHRHRGSKHSRDNFASGNLFHPRVRMYELQMMGLMEMGMADIAIPYLGEKVLEDNNSLRKWKSHLSTSQYSRSVSQSPNLRRKSPSAAIRLRGSLHGSVKESDSIASNIWNRMDEYDSNIFSTTATVANPRMFNKHSASQKNAENVTRTGQAKAELPILSLHSSTGILKNRTENDGQSEVASILSSRSKASRPARAPRNFSYGLKGLMPFKATAVVAAVQVENIKAQKTGNTPDDAPIEERRPKSMDGVETSSRSSRSNQKQERDSDLRLTATPKNEEGSKPIKIDFKSGTKLEVDSLSKQLQQQRRQKRSRTQLLDKELSQSNISDPDSKFSDLSEVDESTPSSITESKIPFVRNVNASNPLKRKSYADTFGRWQHLYPRKPRAATVKWRSLCTPASVPLTTEDFPTKHDLENNYDAVCHWLPRPSTDEISGKPEINMHSLFLEMISLRVAYGYQFVVGEDVSNAIEEELADYYAVTRPDALKIPRLVVVLAMGNTIQKLELHNALSVCVTKYVQKENQGNLSCKPSIIYKPYIRTILSDDYHSRTLNLHGFSKQYPWDSADFHLAGQDNSLPRPVEALQYWRARFVLLPVEPPRSAWEKHAHDEDEEEIHLLGIRALTQLWQRNRYIATEEREIMQKRMGSSKRRDENPLEVKMETLNPSELVALELDRLMQVEEGVEKESSQLLPESQKLDRETSMSKIAQIMQGENGIEFKNRRWHLRFHHNSFHGEEFTNWLMHNVKNMDTRDDAIEFGNQLMKEGLFEHVYGRHKFKDGTYFYTIKPQYRVRSDLQKSWFSSPRQSDRSIPSTPATEHSSKELFPPAVQTRSGSNLAQQLNPIVASETKPFNDKKRKAVSLSRMIRVDVDVRKKSYLGRPEIVNVHYDRFHNPENCYHLELNWFNTTCKLVDDAILSWTNTADKYGLKLVEVPIAEALDVPIAEPFRSPYRIRLALEPPLPKTNNVVFNPVVFSTTPFTPHSPTSSPHAGKHIYQKAILKRSNFVLDLEAISEFPKGVDINYSWGQLDFRYTQFVHRSGVILAQIMDNGDIIVLANRLYNSRLTSTKESTSRMYDPSRDAGPQAHRPAVPPSTATNMQASGIIGVNLASPRIALTSSPGLNPVPNLAAVASPVPGYRPTTGNQVPIGNLASDSGKPILADTFGPKATFGATSLWNTLITPEQIKDDLEAFCLDKVRLEAFYKEVTNTPVMSGALGGYSRKTTGSSSSSLLRPVREVHGTLAGDIMGIPAFELPEAVTAVRELRRATVAYEHVGEMFDRSRIGSRNGSIGSSGHEADGNGRAGSATVSTMSPLRKATK